MKQEFQDSALFKGKVHCFKFRGGFVAAFREACDGNRSRDVRKVVDNTEAEQACSRVTRGRSGTAGDCHSQSVDYLVMRFFRKTKAAAFRARLLKCEAERRRIVEIVAKYQVPLAQILEHMDRVENEIRVLTTELKLIEMPEPEE